MKPVPIHELEGQLATMGRIRAGRKTRSRSGRVVPEALHTFRFTSSDESALEQVAAIYGGTVRPWQDQASPDRFELFSDASEIRVALPRSALTQWYELWSGGGCQRRCDGVTVTLLQGAGPEGGESLEADCMCAQRGEMACTMQTRLSVLLPDVRLLGTWRYDTKSAIAAGELKAAVELIEAVQLQGIQRGVMRLVERMGQGRRRQFTIAQLGLDESLDGLIAGAGRIAAVPGRSSATPPGGTPALGPGEPLTIPGAGFGGQDMTFEPDVVDAEIVEGDGQTALPVDTPFEMIEAWLLALSTHQRNKVLARARQVAEEQGEPVPARFEDIGPLLAGQVMEDWNHA
jgi:hypothetical protein